MDGSSDTDLLLIGKTGTGKSATGNSILRRKAFISIASATSVTTKVAFEVSDFNGRIIKVVDGPGVGDTRLNNEEGVKLIKEAMEFVIAANPRGYHAFLIVLRFGTRFTAEEVEAIALLKKIFGESFVKSYCILVLTGGDLFGQVREETGQSFQEWCRVQEGTFKILLKECDGRAILFDNRTLDDSIKCDQLTRLLQMVDNLRFQGHRYTDENFAIAKSARERAMIEAKVPMIREDTAQETSLILQKLQEVQSQQDLKEKVNYLEKLKIRADNLYTKVRMEDKGTGALREFIETVTTVQRLVDEDIKFCLGAIKEREDNKIKQEEYKKMIENQMEQQAMRCREAEGVNRRITEMFMYSQMQMMQMQMYYRRSNCQIL